MKKLLSLFAIAAASIAMSSSAQAGPVQGLGTLLSEWIYGPAQPANVSKIMVSNASTKHTVSNVIVQSSLNTPQATSIKPLQSDTITTQNEPIEFVELVIAKNNDTPSTVRLNTYYGQDQAIVDNLYVGAYTSPEGVLYISITE